MGKNWGETKSRSALEKSFDDVASRPAGSRKDPVDKIDAGDTGNAQAVTPYLSEIHRHYRETEVSSTFSTHETAACPATFRPLHSLKLKK